MLATILKSLAPNINQARISSSIATTIANSQKQLLSRIVRVAASFSG